MNLRNKKWCPERMLLLYVALARQRMVSIPAVDPLILSEMHSLSPHSLWCHIQVAVISHNVQTTHASSHR